MLPSLDHNSTRNLEQTKGYISKLILFFPFRWEIAYKHFFPLNNSKKKLKYETIQKGSNLSKNKYYSNKRVKAASVTPSPHHPITFPFACLPACLPADSRALTSYFQKI